MARVRAGRRRALTAIPEAGQFVLSARFVMPAVVLPTHHCIAATNTTTTTTKSPSAAAAAVTIAAAAATTAGNNITTTTTLYWLPVVDSPPCCFCCYCGDRLFVVSGTTINGSIGSSNSIFSCFDACLPPSRNFGRLCRCDGAVTATVAVVLLVPYVLRLPCFRPIVLSPAFVAAANYIRHHRRIHHLYNTAFAGNNMETR